MTLDIDSRGLVLLGCGRMGGALLQGWLGSGIPASSIYVVTRSARPDLGALGVATGTEPPSDPAAVVIALKPSGFRDAPRLLPDLRAGTTVISVAAGVSLDILGSLFPRSPVIRAMPNTPAFIGRGVTALCGRHPEAVALATRLLDVVGEVVRLEDETLMDAATALSGSGPAYVFHMIEAMAAAGEAAGLDRQTSLQLSRATLAGAGLMAIQTKEEPSVLRSNVTSPNGTTAAGLAPLMDADGGLTCLMTQVIRAAAERSRELNAEIRAQIA